MESKVVMNAIDLTQPKTFKEHKHKRSEYTGICVGNAYLYETKNRNYAMERVFCVNAGDYRLNKSISTIHGYAQGLRFRYYRTGTVSQITTYVDGMKNGIDITYHVNTQIETIKITVRNTTILVYAFDHTGNIMDSFGGFDCVRSSQPYINVDECHYTSFNITIPFQEPPLPTMCELFNRNA